MHDSKILVQSLSVLMYRFASTLYPLIRLPLTVVEKFVVLEALPKLCRLSGSKTFLRRAS